MPETTDFLYPFIEGDETDAEKQRRSEGEEACGEAYAPPWAGCS